MKEEYYKIVGIFKYYSIKLPIYKLEKGYTINKIDFFNTINELNCATKILIKKIRGKISY